MPKRRGALDHQRRLGLLPNLTEVLPTLLQVTAGRPVLAYNARYDYQERFRTSCQERLRHCRAPANPRSLER